jgi:hypothetical protein
MHPFEMIRANDVAQAIQGAAAIPRLNKGHRSDLWVVAPL